VAKNKKIAKIEDEKNSEKEMSLMIGASGTQFFKGFYNISDSLEYVQDLKGERALRTYNQMRKSDPQVKLALLALTHPIVNAAWSIQPPGAPEKGDKPTPLELECTKFISESWFDWEFRWETALRQILSFFWAGFSVFEKSYVYDGKYIKLKKLAQRLPNTIVEWQVENEELIAIKQYISGGDTARQVWIPAEKIVLFTFDQEGGDYRGQSALRAAYKPWFYKDTIQRIQAMQIERWALGIPKITQTDAITSNPNKNKAIEMAENLRAHEKAYAFVPKGFELELLDSGSAKMVDPQSAINSHDAGILKAIMAQFLELGQTETGARSLGETLKDMYLMGLSFSANYVCEVVKQRIFRELAFFNFGANVRPPTLTFSGIQPVQLELLARAYAAIANSSALEMDDPTEAHIREQLGLPVKDHTTSRKKAQPFAVDLEDDEDEDDVENLDPKIKEKKPKEKKEVVKDNQKATDKGGKKNSNYQPTAPVGMEPDMNLWFWRPLRKNEECLSLREMAGRLDDTKERLVKVTRDARAEVLKEIMVQANEAVAAKNPLAVQAIDYSDAVQKKLIKDVTPLLKELIEYGYEQVTKELGRQRTTMATVADMSEEILGKILKVYLKAQTNQFSEKVLDILVDRLRVAAANAVRNGGWDPFEVGADIEQISENTIRRFGGGLINDAFAMGRREAAEEKKDDIAYAEYSAILDNGTCDPCSALDGEQFEIDSAEYLRNSPPLPTCESTASGYNLCRCIWVFVNKEESAPQA
jgi:hypothetical protein